MCLCECVCVSVCVCLCECVSGDRKEYILQMNGYEKMEQFYQYKLMSILLLIVNRKSYFFYINTYKKTIGPS